MAATTLDRSQNLYTQYDGRTKLDAVGRDAAVTARVEADVQLRIVQALVAIAPERRSSIHQAVGLILEAELLVPGVLATFLRGLEDA